MDCPARQRASFLQRLSSTFCIGLVYKLRLSSVTRRSTVDRPIVCDNSNFPTNDTFLNEWLLTKHIATPDSCNLIAALTRTCHTCSYSVSCLLVSKFTKFWVIRYGTLAGEKPIFPFVYSAYRSQDISAYMSSWKYQKWAILDLRVLGEGTPKFTTCIFKSAPLPNMRQSMVDSRAVSTM